MNKMEKVISEIIGNIVIMNKIMDNEVRNTNSLAHNVEKMVDKMNDMMDMIQSLTNRVNELEEEVEDLKEEIEDLQRDENMKDEDKTIQMCNEVVSAAESGNDDDFLESYLKLTEALKTEVREDMKNEEELKDGYTIHREMEYGGEKGILCDGSYKGFNFWIISYGSHPCAYIEIPENHPCYKMTYQDGVYLPVHGGVTFSEDHLKDIVEDTWILGWDYNHYGDRNTFDFGKSYYVDEILREVKEAISSLIE